MEPEPLRFGGFDSWLPRGLERLGFGSGFLIDADGTIVTNHHVVARASEVRVRLSRDSRAYEATVLASDPRTDLALLRIDAAIPLPALELTKTSRVEVGEWVLAIGSPFGFEKTVTAGIVSAMARAREARRYGDFMQIDAWIHPGSSGGPLLNRRGELVGINTAVPDGGNVAIGFAIPSRLAVPIVHELKSRGRIVRGWLGAKTQDLTDELADCFGSTKPAGVLVSDVREDGPAANAGIRQGDLIVSYERKPVRSSRELVSIVEATSIGKVVDLEIVRDGESRRLTLRVVELPGTTSDVSRTNCEREQVLGLTVCALGREGPRRLGIPAGSGVIVRGVRRGGPAEETGLRPGDVILEVNRDRVESVKEFVGVVRASKNETLLLRVLGNDLKFFLTIDAQTG